MHIDHDKLVELLTETSGIEKGKVESQLQELVEEIKEAIAEGDAYEVTGLGVFSGIGNNILFIPSDDFATEINYKYVGMEPIEMDEAAPEETESSQPEAPDDSDLVADAGEDDDPFGGLLDDDDEPAVESSSFELDESADTDTPDKENAQDIEEFADEEEEAPFGLADEELEDETEEDISDTEEPRPGPDKWGIDTYKDDSAERTFSGLLGNKDEAEDEEDSDDSDLAAELSKQLRDEDEGEEDSLDALFGEADVEEELQEEATDQEDEPFADLAHEEEEPEDDDSESLVDSDVIDEDEDEIIPVIKNLASEETKKKRAQNEKEQSEEKDDQTSGKEDTSRKKPARPSTSRDSQGAPVLLWVLLIIVLLAGGTYGLGYFGIVNVPGITPQMKQQASTTPNNSVPLPPPEESASPPVEQNQGTQAQTTAQSNNEPPQETTQTPPQEQAPANQVSQDTKVPAGQSLYGLKGVVNPKANNGFTIVVYSLSSERNAKSVEQKLTDEGYRVLLATIPSRQYGQLWRVSLGQFESLRTAAIAAETLESPLSQNYFITKIN